MTSCNSNPKYTPVLGIERNQDTGEAGGSHGVHGGHKLRDAHGEAAGVSACCGIEVCRVLAEAIDAAALMLRAKSCNCI